MRIQQVPVSVRFLRKQPRHASERISEAMTLLHNHPYIGRAIRGELRELVIAHAATTDTLRCIGCAATEYWC